MTAHDAAVSRSYEQRVPLSFLLAQNKDEQPPVEPTVPFAAIYGEAPKIVTAVLERTAVLVEPGDNYERVSVRHDQVLVDPAAITWRTQTAQYDGTRLQSSPGHGAPHKHRRRLRQASDERALKSQQEVAAQQKRELATTLKAARALRQIPADRTSWRAANAARGRAAAIANRMRNDEEEEAMSAATESSEQMKVCLSCKKEKPASEFPRGLLRAGRVCAECKELKEYSRPLSERAESGAPVLLAAATEAVVGEAGPEQIVKTTRKYRRHAKPAASKRATKKGRRSKRTRTAASAASAASSTLHVVVTAQVAEDRHATVLKLLQKQDELRRDLRKVSDELLELVAAG